MNDTYVRGFMDKCAAARIPINRVAQMLEKMIEARGGASDIPTRIAEYTRMNPVKKVMSNPFLDEINKFRAERGLPPDSWSGPIGLRYTRRD